MNSNFKLKIKNYLEGLQNLPDNKKKIILWVVVGVLAVIMGFFWIRSAGERLNKIGESMGNINFPQMETPQINIPNITDQTADWKTYTNNQYGFEIKYPEGWDMQENIPNKKFVLKFTAKENYPVLAIQFLADDYSKIMAGEEKKLSDWIKNNPEQPAGVENDIVFSGIPAKEFLYYSPIGAEEQLIIIEKNNLVLQVNSYKNSVLDQMLSTFKFIEK